MKRVLALLLMTFVVTVLLASAVYASTWEYRYPIYVTDTSGADRTNVPVLLGFGGQNLVNANKILASGLDTNMQSGVTDVDYMMSTTQVTSVIPSLPAGGRVQLDLYTGYSPLQTSFPIITGEGGCVTTIDTSVLELLGNGTVSVKGVYVDTSTSGTIFQKDNAVYCTKGSGNITASFYSGNSTQLNYVAASTQYCHKDAGVTSPSGSAISIDVWAKRATAGVQHFIWNNGVAGSANSWYLVFTAADKIQLVGTNNGAGTAVSWVSTNATVAGTQYFITATYDNSRGTKTIVDVNGKIWGGADGGAGGTISQPTTFLGIGGGYNGAWVATMNGKIDEVRISNTARTQADHISHYNSGTGVPFTVDANTVSLWHFNEGAGASATDTIGVNNLALVNNPTWVSSPVAKLISISHASTSKEYSDITVSANNTSSDFELWLDNKEK